MEHTLDDGIDNPLLLGAAAPGGQVTRDGLVNLDEASIFVDDVELVLVDQLVVAGAQLANGLIVLVHDGDVAVSVAVAGIVVAFKAEQHVFALPAGGLEVGRPDAVDAVARPHQVAVITEDVGASLARTVLFGRSIRVPGKRGHKEVPLFDVLGGRDGDIETGRRQVGPGAELPVGRDRSKQQVGRKQRGHGSHGGAA